MGMIGHRKGAGRSRPATRRAALATTREVSPGWRGREHQEPLVATYRARVLGLYRK